MRVELFNLFMRFAHLRHRVTSSQQKAGSSNWKKFRIEQLP
jgi:hypothetical protein